MTRQEAADLGKLDWSQLDYGLHAKYFHHVTSSLDTWCSTCHTVDHRQAFAKQRKSSPGEPPKKRPSTSQPTALKRSLPERTLPDGTHNFNYGNGVCRFGPKCTYALALPGSAQVQTTEQLTGLTIKDLFIIVFPPPHLSN